MKLDDDAKRRSKREARAKIPFLIAVGNEQDMIAYARKWNPEITAEEMKEVITLFWAAKHERGHSQ